MLNTSLSSYSRELTCKGLGCPSSCWLPLAGRTPLGDRHMDSREKDLWLTRGPPQSLHIAPKPRGQSYSQRPLKSFTLDQAMPSFAWAQFYSHSTSFLPQPPRVNRTTKVSKHTVLMLNQN